MHTSFSPFSRSYSSMQTHTVTVACSVMDAGHKDGQEEKVSHIRVCGLLMDVCSESGGHVDVFVFEPMCVTVKD